ncbi:MAG: relaxase/mobilization nuclease domain-containing protein [Cohaesibacter sp.]|nr:relaxase/mobilization nuclease domain-containing protein [Cohaesibacter sp.]
MILKGSQRGGAKNLSTHLMNDVDNDHVELYELRGFLSRDLHGALAEAYAISKGTKCSQFMFSLSFNPPKDADASEQDFKDAIEKAEQKLGLDHQPRAIVFHEKEGRRHAHVVWSRIDAGSMKAINLPHFKNKLKSLARDLYLDHGWELPDGLRRDGGRSPLNFTLAEWQQAKRLKLDPREIKQSFQEAWKHSDNAKAFRAALEEKGYFLARGDRRGFVALNVKGEVFSIPRMVGVKTKEVKAKLGDPASLHSVDQIRDILKSRVSEKIQTFMDEVDQKHERDFEPLKKQRKEMVKHHRTERAKLKEAQQKRWQEETKERSARLNKGLRGFWQKISGAAATIKQQNEKESWQGLQRDQNQRDGLIKAQMQDRRVLQREVDKLRRKHTQNRAILAREVTHAMRQIDQANREQAQSQERQRSINRYRGPSL